MPERHDIFVRAHAPLPPKAPWCGHVKKWPDFALVFDTETKLDPTQKLTFGCFHRCELKHNNYSCVEEGLFFADDLRRTDQSVLKRYVANPFNVPKTEIFPPQLKLRLMSRNVFVREVFWGAVRRGDLIVGFNLPYDLSRLAVKFTAAQKGGWSLAVTLRESKKTGDTEVDIERPRIVIRSINSKMAFFRLSSKWRPEEWPNEPRFLDLRTLAFALRNVAYSLSSACDKFGVKGKMSHTPTGKVTPEEISYCREDVAATGRLLNAAKREFDQHPIKLRPDQAYSPASIAKAYLDAMNIVHPKEHFKVANKIHGIAMQAYYGGRAECRIRKTPVPVILTDFTSQYPTVNALLGNWSVLTASETRFRPCTREIRKWLSKMTFEDTFSPAFWRNLAFFALVKPEKDILPVRTVYNGRTRNIGLNYLSSQKPIWYAGPDLVASALLQPQGRVPHVIKAVRLLAVGRQRNLSKTDLAGMVAIDPRKDDFFVRVVEQRNRLKPSNPPVSEFLKVVGNSGSYGLFVQVDPETRQKPKNVRVYSGETIFSEPSRYVEKTGPWYFPPLASLITSGGRLLLAMLERCIQNAGGSYLFCDTDSMCIVGSERGGEVLCIGGKRRRNAKEVVKALSFENVKAIARRFNQLNPYDSNFVPDLLKIESINFADSNRSKPLLSGYAIAAKRYALYAKSGNEITVVKASGHGLGYLFAPKKNRRADKSDDDTEDNDKVPVWVVEAWEWLIRRELGLQGRTPAWLSLPAMMRMTMTSPNVMRHNRPEWLAPFNFFLFPLISDLGGYPPGLDRSTFNFIVPFDPDRRRWKTLEGINLWDEEIYQIAMRQDGRRNTVVPESLRIILGQYLRHPEAKSLAPAGTACTGDTCGLLGRTSIVAGEIIPVGKETDRHWEQGEDPSLLDFKLKEYRKTRLVVADASDRRRWKRIGVRNLMRKSRLSQKAVYAIINAEPVRRATLETFRRAVDG